MRNKISIVTTNITNNGGTERVIANVANSLSEIYDIRIYSLSTTEGECFYPLNERIHIKHMGMMCYEHEKSVLKKTIKKLINVFYSINEFKKIRSNYIIGVNKNINILLVLSFLLNYKRKRDYKLIGWEHFTHNAPMSLFTRILRELLYKYLDDLIVLTKFDEEYYKAKKIKTTVIENAYTAMDVDNLNTISKGNVILSIGRHTSQKRFDKLLHIWKEIVKKNDGLKLRIVGDGPLLDENKKLAQKLNLSDSVVFAPPTKKINEEYQNASLFLMTSDYEAFPMVLLEALKNGLPCIAFDCDTGPRDIIVNGVDGFVIPINDSLKFVEKTIDVMNDENLRYQLSSNAKVNVERFNEEHISKKWLIKLKQLQ